VTRKNSKEETLKGAEDPHHSGPPSEETEEDTEALKQLCNAVQEQNSLPIVTECAEMENNVTRLVEDNSSIFQGIAPLKEAENRLELQSEKLKDEIGRLLEEVKEIKVIRSKYATVVGQLSSVIQQRESLKQEKEEMASEIQKLKEEMEMLLKRKMEVEPFRTEYDNIICILPELVDKLNNAIREKDSLKEVVNSMASEKESLNAEKERIIERITETKAMMTECLKMESRIKEIVKENSSTAQEIECLNETKKTLETQIVEVKHEMETLQKKVKEDDEIRIKCHTVMGQVNSVIQENESLKQKKGVMTLEIQKLKEEKERLFRRKMEVDQMVTECDNMMHSMPELEKKLKNAVGERDYLENATVALTSEMKELKAEKESLLKRVSETKSMMTKYSKIESRMEELGVEISNTIQKIERLTEDKDSLESQNEKLQNEMKELQEKVKEGSAVRSNYVTMKGQLNSKIKKIKSLKQEEKVMASKIQKVKADNERLHKGNMETKALRTELENMMHSIPELEEKLINAVAEKNRLQENIVSLTSEMEMLKAEEKMLLEGLCEREAILTDFQYLKRRMTGLEEELSNAVQETERLKNTRESLESQIEELIPEVVRLREKGEENNELKSEYFSMMGKVKCKVDSIKRLKHGNVIMASDICRLNDELEMLVNEPRCAVEERDPLQEVIFETEALEAEQERLCEEDKALRTEYNYMNRRITKLEQELHLVLEQKVSATHTIEWLMSKTEKLKEELEILNETNKEAIAFRTACDDTKQI
jgi:chromosome segregation ATPase